jgi:hypothetical protein
MYSLAAACYRIAIGLLYFRISSGGALRYGGMFTVAFDGLLGTGGALAAIFQCAPVRKAWDTTLPGTCINVYALGLSTSIMTTIQD